MSQLLYPVALVAIHKQSLTGAYQDVALVGFAKRVTHGVVKNMRPTKRVEAACSRLKARNAGRSGQPYAPFTVGQYGLYPVVAQLTFLTILLIGVVVNQPTCSYIIDTESARKSRDVYLAFAIIGKHIKLIAVILGHLLIGARQGVIAIECLVSAHPVAALRIAVYRLDGHGRFRLLNQLALQVKAIYTIFLYRAPNQSVIALTDGCDRGTYGVRRWRDLPTGKW